MSELYLAFNLVYKSKPAFDSSLLAPRQLYKSTVDFSQSAAVEVSTTSNDASFSGLTSILSDYLANPQNYSLAETISRIGQYADAQAALLQVQTYPGWYVESANAGAFSLIQIAPAYVLYELDCEATAMTKHLGCYTANPVVSLSSSGLDLAATDAHVGGKLHVGGELVVGGMSALKGEVFIGAQEAVDFMGNGKPYFVVTPESAAQTTLYGSMSVFGSKSYINGNRVNDAGGKLIFDLVDLRGAGAPKSGSVTLQSREVGELTINAEAVNATGALNVAERTTLGGSLHVGEPLAPAYTELNGPVTLNGAVTMSGNVTMEGCPEASDDAGGTTVSISLGAIKIYVSTIGRPQLEENAIALSNTTEGSLFINTIQHELFIYEGSNQWKQL